MSTQHAGISQITDTEGEAEEKVGEQGSASTSKKSSDRFGIIISMVALYILWGATYLGMRVALQSFPPFLLAGIRFLVSGSLMFLFLLLRGAPLPTRKQWLGAAVIGALLLIGGNGGVTFAEQWVPSGLTAVATGAVPLWAALFAGFFGRWPSRFEWLGLVLGFAGLILLNLGHGLAATNPLGTIVLLFSPISWALGSILSQRVALPKGFMATAAQLLCGGIMLLGIGLASGERVTQAPTWPAIWAMIFLIAGGTWIAYTAYGYLLSHVRASLATSYAYVNPIVAVALGV
ncbi:MAG TPA: drug/metabolite exporter YedA, partial [Ktedonobacteraceae bacterium]